MTLGKQHRRHGLAFVGGHCARRRGSTKPVRRARAVSGGEESVRIGGIVAHTAAILGHADVQSKRGMTMYVAGEWRRRHARGGGPKPYDGEVVGVVPVADADDAELAVAAAVDGARAMRALSACERSEILRRAADRYGARLRGARPHDRVRGRQAARRGARRGGTDPRRSCARARREGARMHGETVPVDSAANGAGKIGLHDPPAVRRRRRDLAVQLPRAARRAQGRACARSGQRCRAEARARRRR